MFDQCLMPKSCHESPYITMSKPWLILNSHIFPIFSPFSHLFPFSPKKTVFFFPQVRPAGGDAQLRPGRQTLGLRREVHGALPRGAGRSGDALGGTSGLWQPGAGWGLGLGGWMY